jgi:EAL domain-containing protein (putative c-di-GMP-specific phosphodiesterase class I)
VVDRSNIEEAIRRAVDPRVLMQRVADEAMTVVEGVEGVLIGFVHDPAWLTVECASGYMHDQIGSNIPVEGSLSGLVLRTGETLCCDDAENDSRVEVDMCHSFDVGSSVCLPLWRGDQTVGVFNVNSSRKGAFEDCDVVTLTRLAKFISIVITEAVDLAMVTDSLLSRVSNDARGMPVPEGAGRAAERRFVANVLNPGAIGRLESRGRVTRFLSGRGLNHLFQPVFDITNGQCIAVEALARFSGRPQRSPDVWFAEAHMMGLGVELEEASVRMALKSLSRLPEDIALCLNAGPEAIISAGLRRLVMTCDPRRVVLELTEESRVDDYLPLSHVLDELRSMGVRLAIDDTGAGFASLAHILKLSPDLIKLDRELTCGIDHDPVRIALATALVRFAAGIGAEIIAEGIETAAELEVLQGLRIRYGQGFFLCRPTTLDLIPSGLPIEVWSATAA